jgi:preprotein translocase subunit SecA
MVARPPARAAAIRDPELSTHHSGRVRSERHLGQDFMDWDTISDKLTSVGDTTGRWLKKAFGSHTEREVRNLAPLVKEINELESWAQGLSAEQFKAQTAEWKAHLAEGERSHEEMEAELRKILPRAFAMTREASVRTLGLRHFDVQLVGGIILHDGKIAEMMTGEGKTLVATLPFYLNALAGRPVYLVTVNDYLARRDCAWMKPIYDYLGVSSGSIQSSMHALERKPIYACDIVYGTNNEFGFDYLRDNMKVRVEEQVQKHLAYAIIDEVDSILIDEARTPLIISGPAEESSDKYKIADKVARTLVKDEHFEVKEKERTASLLEAGIEAAERIVGVDSFYTPGNEEWPHFIENALRAHNLYKLDDQYVVEEGEVVIVDEFTGRKMSGRRWSDGLHQAVETKEGLTIRRENQTLATITFQNYFRLFSKLAGMTGTALTEASEFFKIYRLDVIQVPTNLPLARVDNMDVVYRTEQEKWTAISDEIELVHKGRPEGALDEEDKQLPPRAPGQPLLIGTTSVEKSELLSGMLSRRGIGHEVLNAKNHEREAQIVARAGEMGAVTVATNMAGRGTDIKLGGNFEYRLGIALKEAGLEADDLEHLDQIAEVRERVRAECERDQSEVLALGGLYVLGTERHEARRIDNQLRGRSGRQGDAGFSRFFLSLEDDLMRRFYRDWVKNAMAKLGMTEGQEIESRMVTRAIEKAQKKVEDYNFEIRKSLLEYDEVMDEQRKTIYTVRQEVLEARGLREKAELMLQAAINRASEVHAEDEEGFKGWFQRSFGFECSPETAAEAVDKDGTAAKAVEEVHAFYDKREQEIGAEWMRRVEQYLLLNAIDSRWKDHLHAIDALKTGIGLRGYGQQDPKNEYKKEGFTLFQNLFAAVEDEVASLILRIQVQRPSDGGGGGDGGEGAGRPAILPPPTGMGSGSAHHPGAGGQAAQRARQAVRRGPVRVPATQAFDMKRRADALAARQANPSAPPKPAATKTAEPDLPTVGRNDPCPCGSGKKYKKCHGAA